jgi:phosphonate transport system permease protein
MRALQRPLSDPAARPRLWGLLVALAVLWPLWQGAGVQPGALFDPNNLHVIGGFLAGFLPPDTSAEFGGYLWQATLETLAIATIGLLVAFVLAVPLSYWATSAVREKATQNPVARAILTILRGIPELVWALVFVRVFGLGPTAGVLALGLTYGGMLGKVYAEILESEDGTAARALVRSGSPRALALLYGVLPLASKELVSYTVYRWECAIRASVVMGFVGAGGLGQLMDQAMKMLNGGEACSILLVFVLLVLGADALSNGLRRALDATPRRVRRPGAGAVRRCCWPCRSPSWPAGNCWAWTGCSCSPARRPPRWGISSPVSFRRTPAQPGCGPCWWALARRWRSRWWARCWRPLPACCWPCPGSARRGMWC